MKKNNEKKNKEKKIIDKGELLEFGIAAAGVIAFHGLAFAAASALGIPADLLTESGAEFFNETGGKHLF